MRLWPFITNFLAVWCQSKGLLSFLFSATLSHLYVVSSSVHHHGTGSVFKHNKLSLGKTCLCSRVNSSACIPARLSYSSGRTEESERLKHTVQQLRLLYLGSANSEIAEGGGECKKVGSFLDCSKTAEDLEATPSSVRKHHPEEEHQDIDRSWVPCGFSFETEEPNSGHTIWKCVLVTFNHLWLAPWFFSIHRLYHHHMGNCICLVTRVMCQLCHVPHW